ncbi:MAG TPA: extracellular solute-binding protein [Stellaceae bacterium]|nr:extracellular solute-binding protein [Stellaceae bacterium]
MPPRSPFSLTRRSFAAGAAALLAAPAVRAQTPRRVAVMTFGSTWEKVLKPQAAGFLKESGIEIVPVIENSSMEGLARLQASRAAPGVDVWFTGQAVALRAASDKELFLPLPVDRMPNLAQLMPGSVTRDFVAFWYFPTGIVYRPDLVPGGKITSWQELFQPAFHNEIALPAPSVYPGRTIIIAAVLNGGSIDNVKPGIDFLGRMRDQVAMFHSSDTTARRALARGEIWAMLGSPSAVKELADQGIPVAMVCPKPTPLIFEGMMLVKNGNGDAAAEFVNRALAPDWQQQMTDVYNLAPVNPKATAPEALRKLLPTPENALVIDEAKVNEHLGEWTEAFNAAIAK